MHFASHARVETLRKTRAAIVPYVTDRQTDIQTNWRRAWRERAACWFQLSLCSCLQWQWCVYLSLSVILHTVSGSMDNFCASSADTYKVRTTPCRLQGGPKSRPLRLPAYVF